MMTNRDIDDNQTEIFFCLYVGLFASSLSLSGTNRYTKKIRVDKSSTFPFIMCLFDMQRSRRNALEF